MAEKEVPSAVVKRIFRAPSIISADDTIEIEEMDGSISFACSTWRRTGQRWRRTGQRWVIPVILSHADAQCLVAQVNELLGLTEAQ